MGVPRVDSIDPLDAGAESQSARPAYIDVNAQIGPLHGRARGAPRDLLAREQRAHGIRLSLVRSRTALLGDATIGNTEVAEASEEDAALLPVAVLSPDRTDDLRCLLARGPGDTRAAKRRH